MKPQDLDPLCSPYTKEIWIGGNVDLDLLSIFPQEYERIMGGIKRNRKLFKRQQRRRESAKMSSSHEEPLGKKPP